MGKNTRMIKHSILVLVIFILFTSCFDFSTITKEAAQKTSLEETLKIEQPKTVKLDANHIDSIASGLIFVPKSNYIRTKQQIEDKRVVYAALYEKASDQQKRDSVLNQASAYFTKALLNEIIPYWYGTEWDFNGYTDIPNEGEIACGYFVSTTLKHMGLQLNRYKMAQQASKLEVESIAIQKNKVIFFGQEELSKHIKNLSEGLYIVGLDNHVGYLYKHKGLSYFVHSSYVTDRVMIEYTNTSEAFPSSLYYLAPITANKELLEKWLLGQPIKIYTS